MSDKGLIADARAAMDYSDDTGWFWVGPLADALEARQPSEDDREAKAEALKEWQSGNEMRQYSEFCTSWEDGYEAGFSRAAVPDAVTELALKKAEAFDKAVALSERRQTLLEEAEAERDAALAARDGWAARMMEFVAATDALGRVAVEIEAVAGGITSSSEAAGYRNGLLRAAQIARAALDGAPEPEWEYRVEYQVPGGETHVSESMDSLDEARGFELENIHGGVVMRRTKEVPAGPWLPVEGENDD